MIGALLRVLGAGLELWLHKEKTKYQKKLFDLEKEYYNEINKPEDQMDHAVLDNIEFELQLISRAFASEVGEQTSKDLS